MRLTVPGSNERRDGSNDVKSEEDLVPAVLDVRKRRDVNDEQADHRKDTKREVHLRRLLSEGMDPERLYVLQTSLRQISNRRRRRSTYVSRVSQSVDHTLKDDNPPDDLVVEADLLVPDPF